MYEQIPNSPYCPSPKKQLCSCSYRNCFGGGGLFIEGIMGNPLMGHKREQSFAEYLRLQGTNFIYPAPLLRISGKIKYNKGIRYKPDFYLPDTNEYIEVVGSRQAYHSNKKKITQFQQFFDIHYRRPDGKPFPPLPIPKKRYYCKDCKKEIARTRTGYCQECYDKKRISKFVYCRNCGKKLGYYKTKYCRSCAKSEHRYNWKGGMSGGHIRDKKCPDCGALIFRKSKHCNPCYLKFHNRSKVEAGERKHLTIKG